jgi:hypothetical protein
LYARENGRCDQSGKALGHLINGGGFQFFNGLMFASCMMHQAKLQDRIPMECYGSWKNHEAIDVAVNRRLFADLLRQKQIPGAIASVNAESCYDCITHAAGSLCAQQWDVSPQLSLPCFSPFNE